MVLHIKKNPFSVENIKSVKMEDVEKLIEKTDDNKHLVEDFVSKHNTYVLQYVNVLPDDHKVYFGLYKRHYDDKKNYHDDLYKVVVLLRKRTVKVIDKRNTLETIQKRIETEHLTAITEIVG